MDRLIIASVAVCLVAAAVSAAAEERISRVTPSEMKRIMRSTPDPIYPPTGQLRGLKGSGEFRIRIVEETGRITNVEVVKSTGHSELDEAALEALRRWRVRSRSGYDGFLVPITFVR
ncbi:MAG: TonB family protein [Chthoniobacterales bacterium]|nr:TonB family protein [Chthoniobacterales bacterium]